MVGNLSHLLLLLLGIYMLHSTHAVSDPLRNLPGLGLAALAPDSQILDNEGMEKDKSAGRKVFLRLSADLQNQSAFSGDKVQFKCKVVGWPKKKIVYTWYKDDQPIDDSQDPHRISIATKTWGSRLRIKNLLTLDTGIYRCEASNQWRRVQTSAHLSVSFRLPPTWNEENTIVLPPGRCEPYKGFVCAEYLKGTNIYIYPFGKQHDMNLKIKQALRMFSTPTISKRCQRYLLPALCHVAFPPCNVSAGGNPQKGDVLCREDCQILKSDVCHQEYQSHDETVRALFTSQCSELPSHKDSECIQIGLSSSKKSPKLGCYDGNGAGYRGPTNVAKSGNICKVWPKYLAAQYPELLGGHNFCRNPGKEFSQPWCYTDVLGEVKEMCQVENCDGSDVVESNTFLIAGCVGAAVLLVVFGFLICVCKRHKRTTNLTEKVQPPLIEAERIQISRKVKVPELSPSSLHLLVEIGNSDFGKAFKAQVLNDARFDQGYPVVVKMLDSQHSTEQLEFFMREIDVLASLEHQNILSLKAVVLQPNFYCMVFENPEVIDLHQYLIARSPASDIGNTNSDLPDFELSDVAVQIASGLEYLASHGFVHRDVAARNISLCPDMSAKINLHGVVRDAYASNYYRHSPSGPCFPLRWMSPDSIRAWKFLEKADVYSFAILLWELFTFASQPYCGYSSHEVLEMITCGQLLTCPDQCPAKVYSLMHECWAAQPSQRPSFKEIVMRLMNWCQDEPSLTTDQIQIISDVEQNSVVSIPPPEYSTLVASGHPSWLPSTASERSFASSSAPRVQRTSRADFITSQHRFDNQYHPVCGYGSQAPSQTTEITSIVSVSCDSGLPNEGVSGQTENQPLCSEDDSQQRHTGNDESQTT